MLQEQENACAVCGDLGQLVVDHCHTTGKIRGLLCHPCNLSLGKMKDSPELIRKLAEYCEATIGESKRQELTEESA